MAPIKVTPIIEEAPLAPADQRDPLLFPVESEDESIMTHDELYARAISRIEKAEFSRLTRRNVIALFTEFDLDLNGYISISEMKKRFEVSFEQGEVRDMLEQVCSQADSSGDGMIDIEEFYQALCLNVNSDPFKRILRGAEEKRHVWVKRSNIVKFLEDQKETIESCQSLPFYLAFFILSFILVGMHMQMFEVHNSLDSVRGGFSELGDEVAGWSDLENNFLQWASGPLLEHTNMDSPTLPGRISNYNQILGGIKVSLGKSDLVDCRHEELVDYFDIKTAISLNTALKTCRNIDAERTDTKWLLLTHGADKIQELKDSNWVNPSSMGITVTFVTYNAQSSFYVVAELKFDRNSWGKIEYAPKFESFNARPYDPIAYPRMALYVCDGIFILCVCFLLFSELSEFIPTIYRNGFRKGNLLYWGIWNMIDWFNVLMSVAICMVYYVAVAATWRMNSLIQSISVAKLDECITTPTSCEASTDGGKSVFETLDLLLEQGWLVGNDYMYVRGITAVFACSLILAFFKAFRANPRLRVVKDTISQSKEDFIHFSIVFFSIFFSFVLSGYILFGNQVKQFASIGKTIDTCAMMMLGFVLDDIRDEMQKAFPGFGVIWIWLFYIVIAILLFNMILAIIFDVYGDVKSKTGDAQTIFEQFWELVATKKGDIERVRKTFRSMSLTTSPIGSLMPPAKGKKLTNSDILLYLQEKQYHKGEVVTEQSLKDAFGNHLSSNQCRDLLSEADGKEREVKMVPDITTDDILRLVGRVDQNVRELLAEQHQEEAKRSSAVLEHFPSSSPPPDVHALSERGPRAASAKEVAIVGAKLKRLESYTAHRMDTLEGKFTSLLQKLDRLLPDGVLTSDEDHILDVLRDMEPTFSGDDLHE